MAALESMEPPSVKLPVVTVKPWILTVVIGFLMVNILKERVDPAPILDAKPLLRVKVFVSVL